MVTQKKGVQTMSDYKVFETFYSDTSKYEVVERISSFWGASYYIHKNGKHHSGEYKSLKKAVEVAKMESGN